MYLFAILMVLPGLARIPGSFPVSYKTDHFELAIDYSKRKLIPDLANLCEHSYQKLSEFYNFQPRERIYIRFLDEDDFSNGAAFTAQNWVVIYLPPGNLELRGASHWLPDVITHELAHIFTLRKMGDTSHFLGTGIQAGIVDEAFAGSAHLVYIRKDFPRWLVEGLAQYGSMHCGYDTLDTHRQMLLRMALLENHLPAYPELSHIIGDKLEGEMAYNVGFHVSDYLYSKFGGEKVNQMMKYCQSLSFPNAFKKAFGQTLSDVYDTWLGTMKNQLLVNYPGVKKAPASSHHYYREHSEIQFDNKRFMVSSYANDFGITDLRSSIDNKGWFQIQDDVVSQLRLHPDGNKFLYCARSVIRKDRTQISDLYELHISGMRIERRTINKRIISADYTKSGKVFAIHQNAGLTRLVEVSRDGEVNHVASLNGFTLKDVVAGAEEEQLLLSAVSGLNSDIIELDLSRERARLLLAGPYNERDPVWTKRGLLYIADYEGKFDVYLWREFEPLKLTDVAGGAFYPRLQGDTLYYSEFVGRAFKARKKHVPQLRNMDAEYPNDVAFTFPVSRDEWEPPAVLGFDLPDEEMNFSGETSQGENNEKERESKEDTEITFALIPGESDEEDQLRQNELEYQQNNAILAADTGWFFYTEPDSISLTTPLQLDSTRLRRIGPYHKDIRFLGYAMQMDWRLITEPVELGNDLDEDTVRIKSGQYFGLGAEAYWMDPGGLSELAFLARVSQYLNHPGENLPYLSSFQGQYIFKKFLPSLQFLMKYQSQPVIVTEGGQQYQGMVQSTFPVANSIFQLSDYWSFFAGLSFPVVLLTTDAPNGGQGGGLPIFLTGFAYQDIEPAVDFPAQGLGLNMASGFSLGLLLGELGLQGYTNINRNVFLSGTLQGIGLLTYGFTDPAAEYGAYAGFDFSVPLTLETKLGPQFGKGLYFDKLIAELGMFTATGGDFGGLFDQPVQLSHSNPTLLSGPVSLHSTFLRTYHQQGIFNGELPLIGRAGFSLKVIPFYRRAAFWDFFINLDVFDPVNPYFSFSIRL